ncbi:MAG: hypothetical protein MJE68_02305 [Proteobacteria bacterium]|nr:hypothetical protein [Pseudomonadota bacterium]
MYGEFSILKRDDARDYYISVLEACDLAVNPNASLGTLAGQVAAIPITNCPALKNEELRRPPEIGL